MRKLLRIVAVLVALVFSMPVGVYAADSVDVDITATPIFSAGILTFTITYVSDTRLDLDWTVDGTVAKVMVRAKYGSYPADIPDENTAPSDGYLVYYGGDLSAIDTSMNFDEHAGALYYRAWAQKADGKWYVVTKSGAKESKQLVFLGLIGLAVIPMLAGFGFKKSWLLWLAIPFWVILSIYMAYVETWFVDSAQKSLLFIGVGAFAGLAFSAIRMQAKPKNATVADDTLDDDDHDLAEYQKEVEIYNKTAALYHTKRKPRRAYPLP